ncbi:hypothetical protein C3747_330g22 [Trypanosoma cruzi]|uniref:ODAD1 central coiled coil region domain-containing protein n=1 Tax=Trypanosoma cruzi TaxID=5693 RepID=A0A2V2V6L3_TRYCR|nr:hypothetical protein C3747_345g40 [Trypanosoma cruzi]PWU91924.1 hypothetical protein C3747_330g22 [Trypanosoma cruzi]RNC35266.1 hypothetical protein TcCL_Unassigned01867 [Trypanosoma cruzi]
MFDGDPLVQKKKQSVIDVGQRTQLDIVNGEIRRNKETLTNLRLENTKLQVAMRQAVRGQHQGKDEDYFRREEEQLQNKLYLLKRSLNSVTGKKEELAREIERTMEETNFIMKEGGPVVDENSTVGQKIRALENRLDKCLIKHNEVNAIRRTYETLLERLQQEQAGFDTQLAAMEKTLQCKEKDLADLNSVAADATKGRDAAKAELQRLKSQITRERRVQKKDIAERRVFVMSKREQLQKRAQTLRDKIEKGEERRLRARLAISNSQKKRLRVNAQKKLQPEEVEQQKRQRELYNRLKEITMSNNVTDVIYKLQERRDANAQLLLTVKEADSAEASLKEERKKLQDEWEEIQQQNGGTTKALMQQHSQRGHFGMDADDIGKGGRGGSPEKGGTSLAHVVEQRAIARRRVLEEFDDHLSNRQNELEEAQRLQDSLGKMLLDVDAGVHHLAEKIACGETLGSITGAASTARPSLDTTVSPRSNSCVGRGEAIVDLLRSCGLKLQRMLDAMRESELETTAKLVARWHGSLPQSNIRVPLERTASPDEKQAHDDMEDPGGAGFFLGSTEKGRSVSDEGEPVIGSRKWLGAAVGRGAITEDFPENEIHDRNELKMMSITTVERERKKARKQMQQRSKEEKP